MTRPSGSALALLRRAGLRPEGPVDWLTPPRTRPPGVYMVELSARLPGAPLNASAVARWRQRLPNLTVDGMRATQAALMGRLADFWIPSAPVLYIGQASRSVRGRVGDYYKTPLGDARPHAGGHWIKTLSVLRACVVWSAATEDFDRVEDELLDDFARTVSSAERRALHDPYLVLPFANQEDGRHQKKRHGIGGSRLA